MPATTTYTKAEQVQHLRDWVTVLHSGAYLQGQMQLRIHGFANPDRFCCLGVGCDLFRKQTGRGRWTVDAFKIDAPYDIDTQYDRTGWARLPSVEEYFGKPSEFRQNSPEHILHSHFMHLIGMNDSGETFGAIADYIEANIIPAVETL